MSIRPAISSIGVAITAIAAIEALDGRWAIAVALACCVGALALLRAQV